MSVASPEITDAPLAVAPPPPAADAPQGRLSTGQRLVRNTFARGTGQLFTWIATAAVTVLMPRYLGDDNLGLLATAMSLAYIGSGLATLGINSYLTKEVARRGAPSGLVLDALLLRLPLTLLACAIAVGAAAVLNYDPAVRQVVSLLCINIALAGVAGVLTGTLEGMQAMRVVATVDVLSKGALVVAVTLLLRLGYGLNGVAMAWNISTLVMVLVAGVALWRQGGLSGRPDPRRWRMLLAGSLPFFVWQAALMIYGQVDVILLSSLTRPAVVGWYSAAYRIIGIATFAPVIIAGVVFPVLSRSARGDLAVFRAVARRALQSVLLVTVPIALGSVVLAGPLITLLDYPEAFRNSVPLIMILALHVPIMAADMIVGSSLNALDLQRRWAYTAVAAAVLNPSINFLLIPFFERSYGNGALGAAITTVITELFMMTVGLWLLRGRVFDRYSAATAARCVGAGLIMAGATWVFRDHALPIPVLVGAVTYLLASLALGTVSLRDVARLRSYAFARLTPAGA